MLNKILDQSVYTELKINDNCLKAVINPYKSQLFFLEINETIDKIHLIKFDIKKPLYGMTPEEYIEGMRFHKEYFDELR